MDSKKYNQGKYNQTWESKNKEYSSYLKSRFSARSFIRNKAILENLEELKQLINKREAEIKS